MPPVRRRAALPGAILAACAAACLRLAAAHAAVTGSPHDFSATGPFTTSLGASGACSVCHIPHGAADSSVLWPRSLSPYDSALANDGSPSSVPDYRLPPTVSCYDCHDYHGAGGIDDNPPLSLFNASHRPQDIAFGFTKTGQGSMDEDAPGGSVSGYYENKPPHTSSYGADPDLDPSVPAELARTGGHYFKHADPDATSSSAFDLGDKLPCRDCHDPHAWSTGWQAFVRQNWPTSAVSSRLSAWTGRASTGMANAPVSGIRSDSDSRRVCIACHGNASTLNPVNFSDVSSQYSASAGQLVRPPASVREHADDSQVACVECHSHNTVDASCSDCHGFPASATAPVRYPATFTPSPLPGRDAHPQHTGEEAGQPQGSYSAYDFVCQDCHYGSAMGVDPDMNQHKNTRISVVLNAAHTAAASGAYDNTNYFNQAFGYAAPNLTGQLDNTNGPGGWGEGGRYGGNTCRNVYCHSAGRVKSSMAPDDVSDYPRPVWNTGPLACNGCHGAGTPGNVIETGMPNYPTGAAGSGTANSHDAHVRIGRYECSVCHFETVSGTYSGGRTIKGSPVRHVNARREVVFDPPTASGTYDNTAGLKSCSVTCHGASAPRWGGVLANGCFDCHSGTEQAYKPQDDYGTPRVPNPVDNNEYLHSGHGRTGSDYPGSNNLPAGFGTYTAAPADCFVCHSQAAAHTTKSPNDPFRLGAAADGTVGGFGSWTGAWADNTDALCLGCHGTAAQRSGHDNAAQGVTSVDAQAHSQSMAGTKYTWPVTPWKCVDCHDPHGDGRPSAERYMMVRSGINAPADGADGNAGSDPKSRPKRTDANVRAVSFNSLAGYSTAAGVYSYANQGSSPPFGPCEVCHTQPTTYTRTLDNQGSHVTRTGRCTACHAHKAAFIPRCQGCHGPDGVAPTAPEIGAYWSVSGHGKASITTAFGRAMECEDCHDGAYLTAAAHKMDGSVPGTPPANLNTQTWPGKPALNGDTTPNLDTPHLKAGYIDTSGTSRYSIARTFDAFCASAAGCHNYDYHRHQQDNGPTPRDAMRFGDHNTVSNPKAYSWYSLGSYPADFYRSQSPWTDNDVRLEPGLPDAGTSYGLCVTCHDPHGTASTDTSAYPGLGTSNHMVRGNWKTDSGNFCNRACHTKRTPP